jgi:hypothetical protein
MKMKLAGNKQIIIICILLVLLILFTSSVLPACPKSEYTPHELRADIREIVLDYLSDPSSSVYSRNEIIDLLEFYKDEKNKAESFVESCDVKASPSLSDEMVSDILGKTIASQKECGDGEDNDGDGAIDLNDAGCTDLSDDDETNCGDGVCEGGESCSSCSHDCTCPVYGAVILFMKSGEGIATSFKDNGNVVLKGTLTQGTTPAAQDTEDEFIVKDSGGNAVAIINLVTGNMAIKGTLNDKQVSLTNPSGSDFIVKNANGDIVSYISESGNFYLKGNLTENGNP